MRGDIPCNNCGVKFSEHERLLAVVLDILSIEESYDCLEEIGENVHEYIDKHRNVLERFKK